jgi:hypothetical protein
MKHQDHPNLSDKINRNIRESELTGGIMWKDLPTGARAEVQTKNTLYKLEKREEGTYIEGHAKYCPTPTKCVIQGSTWGGSMLKMGWIGIGMHLEFSIERTITTSEIQDVRLAALSACRKG